MATNHHRTKGVRVTVVLDKYIVELLDAWRCQNYIGRKSRSRSIHGILAIFLGVEGRSGCGTPGYGSAWVQKPGWMMKDPRQMKKTLGFIDEVADRLNLNSEGFPNIDQLTTRVDKLEQDLGIQPKKPKLRLV